MARPVPTIQIVNPKDPKGFLVINETDFDPKLHKIFVEPTAADESPAPVVEESDAEEPTVKDSEVPDNEDGDDDEEDSPSPGPRRRRSRI